MLRGPAANDDMFEFESAGTSTGSSTSCSLSPTSGAVTGIAVGSVCMHAGEEGREDSESRRGTGRAEGSGEREEGVFKSVLFDGDAAAGAGLWSERGGLAPVPCP